MRWAIKTTRYPDDLYQEFCWVSVSGGWVGHMTKSQRTVFVDRGKAIVELSRARKLFPDWKHTLVRLVPNRRKVARDALVAAEMAVLDAWDEFSAGGTGDRIGIAQVRRDAAARAYREACR